MLASLLAQFLTQIFTKNFVYDKFYLNTHNAASRKRLAFSALLGR